MAEFIRGKDFVLYFTINGQPEPAAHATGCEVKVTAEVQETTTKNTLKGKTFDYTAKYSYSLSLSGLSSFLDAANFVYFQQAIMQSNKLPFVFTDNESVSYSGTVLVTEVDITSPLAAVSSFANTLQGDGELVITTENIPPAPPFPEVSIVDQFGDVLADISAPGTFSVLKFDVIDGGDSMPFVPQLIITAG